MKTTTGFCQFVKKNINCLSFNENTLQIEETDISLFIENRNRIPYPWYLCPSCREKYSQEAKEWVKPESKIIDTEALEVIKKELLNKGFKTSKELMALVDISRSKFYRLINASTIIKSKYISSWGGKRGGNNKLLFYI